MIKVELKDGIIKEYPKGITALEIVKGLGAGLFKAACACKIDGQVCDLRESLSQDSKLEILTFEDDEGKNAFWHTSSHILAQAVKRLYPSAKLAIGPAIENGFYYDIDCETSFTQDALEKLEAEMKKIVKEGLEITRFSLSVKEAIAYAEDLGETYKVELIEDHAKKSEEISFYKHGEFADLCAGPHLPDTSRVKAIKLTSSTGAYWRGDAKNKMLQRIYGVSFPKKSQLDEHLEALEEAIKRDHNKIGRELGFFTTSDLIGKGLPIMLPKGTKVLQILQRFIEDEEEKRGWQLTKTPLMAKSDLYKVSGHWDHYRDGMFVIEHEDEEKDEVLAMRPMTCPFQYQAYLSKGRSYRDLPIRYNETSTLFRNEASGEMHGLIRLRQFTLSEGHSICTPDQLEAEFHDALDLAIYVLKIIGLYEDVSYRFSQWDENNSEKYIGSKDQWNNAQGVMGKILDSLDIDYKIGIDEAAFYGPKLDIQIKNVYGKEDTLITIQIDMMLAEKFGMEYVDSDGVKKHPYIIHRSSVGCYERTLALLIEKYAGAFPLWLSPEQVRLIPIADRHLDFAKDVLAKLRDKGFRASIDDRSEKLGYKLREAQLEKLPYMLVIGDKEVEEGTVSVRKRGKGDVGSQAVEDFISEKRLEVINKTLD